MEDKSPFYTGGAEFKAPDQETEEDTTVESSKKKKKNEKKEKIRRRNSQKISRCFRVYSNY